MDLTCVIKILLTLVPKKAGKQEFTDVRYFQAQTHVIIEIFYVQYLQYLWNWIFSVINS